MEWINTGLTAVLTIFLFIVARNLQNKDVQQKEIKAYFNDLEKAVFELRLDLKGLTDAIVYLKEQYIKSEKWLLTIDKQVQDLAKFRERMTAEHEANHRK